MKTINKDTIFHFLKNPLGLVGLVTVVFETIAVAAFSYGINKLDTGAERLPIIWFIVGFPILVLFAICLLVIFWHKHLYGPGDYQDEGNFVNANNKKIESKQQSEVKELIKDKEPNPSVETLKRTKNLIERAETYGLNIASHFFGIRLKRDVILDKIKLKNILFDGMGFKGNTLYVAEVKLLPNEGWRGILERGLSSMHNNIRELEKAGYDVEAVFVVVLKTEVTVELTDKIFNEYYARYYNFRLEVAPKSIE